MLSICLKTVLNQTLLVHKQLEMFSKSVKSTVLVNLRINIFVWFLVLCESRRTELLECFDVIFLISYIMRRQSTLLKLRVVSTFIWIEPENKSRKQLLFKYFLWVEPLFKILIVMIFMFLHSSSLDSSTKSTLLKSDFKRQCNRPLSDHT